MCMNDCKIKLISGSSNREMEKIINDFLQECKLVDIKLSSTSDTYDVAIIYSEEKPTEEIKIKLDSCSNCSESSLLEDDINKFMSCHNIIDIKFSSTENSYDVAILYN